MLHLAVNAYDLWSKHEGNWNHSVNQRTSELYVQANQSHWPYDPDSDFTIKWCRWGHLN